MFDIICLGEAMLRLTPENFQTLEQGNKFNVYVGGSELNTAVGLSRLGLKTTWVSKLPKNPLGKLIKNKVQEQGVNIDHIVWENNGRVGLYFTEQGASPRPSLVLYDRKDSAFHSLSLKEINWETLLKQSKWFHISGITPALNKNLSSLTLDVLKLAKKLNCTTSYDLNFRSKLWSLEEARQVQEPMMEFIDILISTEEDINNVFKIIDMKNQNYKKIDPELYYKVAEKIKEKYRNKIICITLRENPSVLKNTWNAIAYDGKKFYTDEKRECEVIDRIGSGDSFTAGFIYGYYTQKDIQYALKFGNAYACLKHSIPGDFNYCNKQDVENLLKNNNIRIKR